MDDEGMPLLKCPKCKHENDIGTKFCQGCGARIKWIYAERECTHCGNRWKPRTANPKNCPGCGYRLSRDDFVEIEVPIQARDIGDTIIEVICFSCGKVTRRFVEFRINKDAPVRNSCYICMEDYFKKKNAEDIVDIVEGSFRTEGIERLEDGSERLIKE